MEPLRRLAIYLGSQPMGGRPGQVCGLSGLCSVPLCCPVQMGKPLQGSSAASPGHPRMHSGDRALVSGTPCQGTLQRLPCHLSPWRLEREGVCLFPHLVAFLEIGRGVWAAPRQAVLVSAPAPLTLCFCPAALVQVQGLRRVCTDMCT